MVGLTFNVERIQSDNKGKIVTAKKALTNRNLHCKEIIQCNLIGVWNGNYLCKTHGFVTRTKVYAVYKANAATRSATAWTHFQLFRKPWTYLRPPILYLAILTKYRIIGLGISTRTSSQPCLVLSRWFVPLLLFDNGCRSLQAGICMVASQQFNYSLLQHLKSSATSARRHL